MSCKSIFLKLLDLPSRLEIWNLPPNTGDYLDYNEHRNYVILYKIDNPCFIMFIDHNNPKDINCIRECMRKRLKDYELNNFKKSPCSLDIRDYLIKYANLIHCEEF